MKFATLTGGLTHFRLVMRSFYDFRVGVFGGARDVGGVVACLGRPEVGAAYQKSVEASFPVPEGAAGGLIHRDVRVEGP